MADPSPIDAYLAPLPAEQRELLEHVRAWIRRLLPDAVETISYGIPAFKMGDTAVVWFAAWKRHCSIYPVTAEFLAANADALRGHGRTKGGLHFTPQRPLSEALVEGLVRDRLAALDIEGARPRSARKPRGS